LALAEHGQARRASIRWHEHDLGGMRDAVDHHGDGGGQRFDISASRKVEP
jgi:hypothetical protein